MLYVFAWKIIRDAVLPPLDRYHWKPDQAMTKFKSLQTKALFALAALVYSLCVSAEPIPRVIDFKINLLNNPSASGPDTLGAQFSPDGQWVVYVANELSPQNEDLFVTRPRGGEIVQLNKRAQPNADVSFSRISPSSDTVIYWSDQDTDEVFELYSVPINGGVPPVKLNGQLTTGGDVKSAMFTPDGKHVIYRADQDIDETFELYSVSINGGKVTKLNKPLVEGRNVKRLGINVSPDSTFVTYIADQDQEGTFELFLGPIGAGAGQTVQLSQQLVAGERINETNVRSSLDSRYVLYTVGPNDDKSGKTELFSASTDIANPSIVNLSLALETEFSVFFGRISNDSSRVVMTPWDVSNGFRETGLYSISIRGGTPIRLDSDENMITRSFNISSDDSTVIYSNNNSIYSTPILGGEITVLDDTFESLRTPKVFLNDERLIYTTTRSGLVGLEVRSTSINESNAIIMDRGNVVGIAVTPNGDRIFYGKQGDDGGFYTSSTSKKDVLKLFSSEKLGSIQSGSVRVDPTGLYTLLTTYSQDGKARLFSVRIPDASCDTFVIKAENGNIATVCL